VKQEHRLKGNLDLSFKINLKEGTGPWKNEFEWKNDCGVSSGKGY